MRLPFARKAVAPDPLGELHRLAFEVGDLAGTFASPELAKLSHLLFAEFERLCVVRGCGHPRCACWLVER